MITFKAVKADDTSVMKINSKYGHIITRQPAVLAEMSPFSQSDSCSMKKIPCIWGNKGVDAHLIADCFEFAGDNGYGEVDSRYFVLTEQTENLGHIKPVKVLGITQTSKRGKNKTNIDYMQVNPFFVYNNPYSKFLNVGTTMLDSIKKIFAKDEITLYSTKSALEFFKKNGFEIVKDFGVDDILMKLKK